MKRQTHLFFSVLMILLIACKEKSTDKTITVIPEFRKDGQLWLIDNEKGDTLQTLEIEIANDDFEVQTGLMYRPSMAENRGMLFVFKQASDHAFYMKNTLIPLDIIFIDSDKRIVNIHKNAHPLDESSLPSDGPVQYVLEINGGLSDLWQLKPGDKISWE